jgi:beta-galactosidase
LTEDSTYDVAAIRIKVTDEYGNVVSYFNRPAELEVSGDIEMLGPDLADINGGMGGIYVRSMGRPGNASVNISFPGTDLAAKVDFEITCDPSQN